MPHSSGATRDECITSSSSGVFCRLKPALDEVNRSLYERYEED